MKCQSGEKLSNCKYYPCHKMEGLRCEFCYCPLYPCGEKETGGKWYKGKNGKKVWDCTGCKIVHDITFVNIIKNYFWYLVKVWSKKK